MRRKSERNKGKASPEKKVEKPTRKSTRRRGKKSPSTSPDRAVGNETSTGGQDNDNEATMPTRNTGRESEKANEANNAATKESAATKEDFCEESADGGSVWKVARADASPGEIQKLKLCRQRNLSETSEASSSRKRSNKWHDGGESITEEIDSADERSAVTSSRTMTDEAPTTEKNASVLQGRDSSEEVSDSKEFPPEIATAELSDVKPNIDHVDQGETSETASVVDANAQRDKPRAEAESELTSSVDETRPKPEKPEEQTIKEEHKIDEPTSHQDHEEERIKVEPEDPAIKVEIEQNDKTERPDEHEKDTSLEETKVARDPSDSKESISDEADVKTEKESSAKRHHDSSDDEISDEDKKRSKVEKAPAPRTSSRRKHRDKYRDSSNSETGDSEDESERDSKRIKRNTQEPTRISRDSVETAQDQSDEKDDSCTPEATEISKDTPADTESKKIDNEKTKNEETERPGRNSPPATNLVQSQNNYKPAKVNLKRSFAARPSVESVEMKKNTTENETNDLVSQNKENHASSEQPDTKSIPKKRRWGTILAPADPTPAFSISTESLKVLVPGAKPLPMNEVRLSKDDDDEKDRRTQREKRYSVAESSVEQKSRDDDEKPKNVESKKEAKGDNHIVSRRKISIVKDTQNAKSPSPPAAIPTNILLIKNLVRPFTLNQIRELLSRTGTIVENGFWMDRIKSKCFVEYVNEDQAFETRQALHGISWPVSNPKKLQVEYATKEDMELARELSKDQPMSRKAEPLAANDGWQQDWARDERTNSMPKVTVVREWDLGKEDGQQFAKDKERDKKELEKKRRQRSRSPTLEAHLPAPARKFKKKEDDPPPAKLLDDLFRKTKATPCIYWLPLTNEQIVVKEEMRRQHMAEHARRLEEMRRAERNRDGRRRRSPRK